MCISIIEPWNIICLHASPPPTLRVSSEVDSYEILVSAWHP